MGHARQLRVIARPAGRRSVAKIPPTPATPARGRLNPQQTAILQLQRSAGNQAVVRVLQRDKRTPSPELAPVTDLRPAGTLDEKGWKIIYDQAVSAAAKGDARATTLYTTLMRDAAITAGVAKVPGFDPDQIAPSDAKSAKPGLNLSLNGSLGSSGKTAWIDTTGRWGASIDPTDRSISSWHVGVVILPGAFEAQKALSLGTIRHEMVHAQHRLTTQAAIIRWQQARSVGKPDADLTKGQSFEAWLTAKPSPHKLSAVDRAVVGKVAKGGSADTEVLAYVEGFTTSYHHTKATVEATKEIFAELLGPADLDSGDRWTNATDPVRNEAMARLQAYWATLGAAHRDLWRQWLAGQVKVRAGYRDGRTRYLAALGAFVR